MKDWLNNLVGRIGLALLKFSCDTQAKRRQRLRSSSQVPLTKETENAEEIEKEKAEKAKQEAKEEQWRKNGCFKDSSGNWVVPDELMWRSLPRGEDR